MKRLFWFQPGLDDVKRAHAHTTLERRPVKTSQAANLVSSLTDEGMHLPALDIDVPCRLVESSTKGHFHLFIDKPMTWEEYRILLDGLARAGIIEQGFAEASLDRGASFLRTRKAKRKVNVNGGGYKAGADNTGIVGFGGDE